MEQNRRGLRRLERQSNIRETYLYDLGNRHQESEEQISRAYPDLQRNLNELRTDTTNFTDRVGNRFRELEEGQQRIEDQQYLMEGQRLPFLEQGLQRSFNDLAAFDTLVTDWNQELREGLRQLWQHVPSGPNNVEYRIQIEQVYSAAGEHLRNQVQELWDGHHVLETRLRHAEGRQQRQENRWRDSARLENGRLQTLHQIQVDMGRLQRHMRHSKRRQKENNNQLWATFKEFYDYTREEARKNKCRCNREDGRSSRATSVASKNTSRGGARGGQEPPRGRRLEPEGSNTRDSQRNSLWFRSFRTNEQNTRQNPPPAVPSSPSVFGSRQPSPQSFTKSLRTRSPTSSVANRIINSRERSRQVLERAEPVWQQFRQRNRPVLQDNGSQERTPQYDWEFSASPENLNEDVHSDRPPQYSRHTRAPYPYNLDGTADDIGSSGVAGSKFSSSSSSSSSLLGEIGSAPSSHSPSPSSHPPVSQDSIPSPSLTPDEIRRELHLREWLMYLAAVPQSVIDEHLSHSLITLQHETELQRLRTIRFRLRTHFHTTDSSIRWPDPERPGHFILVRQVAEARGRVRWTQEPLTPQSGFDTAHEGESLKAADLSDFHAYWD